MFVVVRQMHVELHALDAGFLFAGDVKVVAVELQFFQFVLQLVRVHAQINHRADEHVTADAAENVEVKRFHFSEGRVPRGPNSVRTCLTRPSGQGIDLRRRAARAEAVSMFTTVTPLPQLFNIPSSAATPRSSRRSHARRHCDDRLGHQPRDDARQRALHAGDHDEHVRLLNRFQPPQQPVQPGHARVRHALDAVAHDFRRHRRLLRHGQIARAGANDRDDSRPPGQRLFLDGDTPRQFVVDGELNSGAISAPAPA